MSWKVRAGVALAMVVVLGFGATALAAIGGDATIKVDALQNGKSRYFGKVRSDEPRCESHRKVKVTAGDSILVRTRTDEDGRFDAVGKSARPGRKLTVKVAPKGELCLKLLGTGRAPSGP